MKAPWLTAAGFPERVALINMFTSPHWRRLAMNDNFYVAAESITKFINASPPKARFAGPAASGSRRL
ncbi:hypothetical protein ACFVSQ_10550 [Streptomyces niveus]|uniref:hypothetical protein n=1 Tax=Streptomyces niveus TaxID=193462 RepID=UPI0036E98865